MAGTGSISESVVGSFHASHENTHRIVVQFLSTWQLLLRNRQESGMKLTFVVPTVADDFAEFVHSVGVL